MSKPIVTVLRSAPVGGTALNVLSSDLRIPSLADIWPYAPKSDRADLDCVGEPQARINYDS